MADTPPTRHSLAEARERMPGLGFAFYVGLLLLLFLAGLTGITVAMSSIFWASEGANPFVLTYGGNVEPALLGPMRAAKLIGADEVPDAFHTEDMFGSTVCAVKEDRFLRLGPEGVRTFPLATITTVEQVSVGVRVVGNQDGAPVEVLCGFQPDEGAERFVRMLSPKK